MKIIIAGAGIGGLTAAMCLHRAGFDVHVYEAVSELKPLGVGINIQAGAVRILSDLGLEPALAATGIETRELRYANRHGQTIWADPRGRHAGLPWPQFSIHRGELQMILLEGAQKMLGAGRIHFDRRIAGFEQRGQKVLARFTSRDGGSAETVEADLQIGADGIHSTVRAQFFPNEGPPKWQGILMWRGVTIGKPYLGGATMVQAGYHNQKFVCYPISKRHADRGEALINWICDIYQGEHATPPRQSIVTVFLRDGSNIRRHILAVRGTADNRMGRAEVLAKAEDLITPVLGSAAFRRISEFVFSIEEIADMSAAVESAWPKSPGYRITATLFDGVGRAWWNGALVAESDRCCRDSRRRSPARPGLPASWDSRSPCREPAAGWGPISGTQRQARTTTREPRRSREPKG